MRRLLILGALAGLLGGTLDGSTARAEEGSSPVYKECEISIGSVMVCYGGYTGSVIAEVDGVYKVCETIDGKVDSCSGPHTGKAVVLQDGRYRTCVVRRGKLGECGQFFSGRTVVAR